MTEKDPFGARSFAYNKRECSTKNRCILPFTLQDYDADGDAALQSLLLVELRCENRVLICAYGTRSLRVSLDFPSFNTDVPDVRAG